MNDFWQGKRIFLSGVTGFLGGWVGGLLAHHHAAVNAGMHTDVDLASREECLGHFRFLHTYCSPGPEMVIHCAGLVGGIQANLAAPGTFFRENILMGINILDACVNFGVEKLVMLGTTCSYPREPITSHVVTTTGETTFRHQFREHHLWDGYPDPSNAPYGIAKRALLTMCQAYREQYGLKTAYVIPANLYGPGDHFEPDRSHVIPALIRKCIEAAEAGEPSITVWGAGHATREFLYVEDAADAILRAAEVYDDPEPINIGTGEEVSIRQVAELIAEATGFAGDILWDASKPEGQPRRCLNVERANRELDWRARTGLREGLEKTVAWYREQRACVPLASASVA